MLINCSLFLEIKNDRKIRPSRQQGQGGDTNNSNENDDTDEVEQPPHTITKTKSRMNRARDVM